jgi:hypothetical protein
MDAFGVFDHIEIAALSCSHTLDVCFVANFWLRGSQNYGTNWFMSVLY